MGFSTGSTTTIEGGTVNATGRFGVAAAGNSIVYTQTAGTITVCMIGNASATLGSFDLGTSLGSTISMSGGTIVVQLAATAIDYRDQAGSGIVGVTGGTLQLGNAASGAAKTFNLRGVLPNVVVTNTSAGHSGVMSTTLVNFNNIGLNVTVATGATFNIGNVIFLMAGQTMTNNGTLTANGASSNFVWFRQRRGSTDLYRHRCYYGGDYQPERAKPRWRYSHLHELGDRQSSQHLRGRHYQLEQAHPWQWRSDDRGRSTRCGSPYAGGQRFRRAAGI
jgi:hypothetical protein